MSRAISLPSKDDYFKISDYEALEVLKNEISKKENFVKLDMSNIRIDNRELHFLKDLMIQGVDNIKELDLFLCNIDREVGNYLRIFLSNSQNLETLNISATSFYQHDLAHLFNGIIANTSISNLSVTVDDIGIEEMLYFVGTITSNSTIQNITINFGNIDWLFASQIEIKDKFIEALSSNYSITHININSENELISEFLEEIKEFLDRNTELQQYLSEAYMSYETEWPEINSDNFTFTDVIKAIDSGINLRHIIKDANSHDLDNFVNAIKSFDDNICHDNTEDHEDSYEYAQDENTLNSSSYDTRSVLGDEIDTEDSPIH